MLALLKYLNATLKETGLPVFHEQAPQGTARPYLTFTITGQIDQSYRDALIVDVNLWYDRSQMTLCEAMVDRVVTLLNGAKQINEDMGLRLYLDSILRIPDPEPSIARRRVRFTGYLYTLK